MVQIMYSFSSSLRTLPLVRSFRQYFEEVKTAQARNKEICGNSYNYAHDGYVFVDEMGDRIKPNWLTVTFPDFVEKHGLPRMRFHDLRHTYAVAAIKSGDDIKTVQENLGHATAAFTLDVYGHVTNQMKEASASRMELFISAVSS